METKADLYLLSPYVFIWHGAEKGSDRFYAWLDALSHLKRKDFIPFLKYT